MHRHLTKFLNLTNQSHEKQFGFKKNFMAPFYGWDSTASRLQNHYEEAI